MRLSHDNQQAMYPSVPREIPSQIERRYRVVRSVRGLRDLLSQIRGEEQSSKDRDLGVC